MLHGASELDVPSILRRNIERLDELANLPDERFNYIAVSRVEKLRIESIEYA
jgi:hypothetical protein